MILDDETHVFLQELANRSRQIGRAIQYCEEKRASSSPHTKIFSVFLLEMFLEFKGHLEDYETEIDAKYGFSTADEQSKLALSVLDPFVSYIRENNPNTVEQAFNVFEKLIISFETFKRESGLKPKT